MKHVRVPSHCCKCGADIVTADNRINSTMCETCRKQHMARYNADYGKLRRTDEYKSKQRIRIIELALCPVCFNIIKQCACPENVPPLVIDANAWRQPKGAQWIIEPYYWQ